MSPSLFQLFANLLLITANSLTSSAPAVQTAASAPNVENRSAELLVAEQRHRARAARISLADPYYSFSRTKRANPD